MLLQLCFFIGSFLALTYRKGETFSYSYTSTTVQRSQDSSNDECATIITLDAQANFKVISISSDGAFIEMRIQNVGGDVSDGHDKESVPSTDASEQVSYFLFYHLISL
jgi:hypothetical protein